MILDCRQNDEGRINPIGHLLFGQSLSVWGFLGSLGIMLSVILIQHMSSRFHPPMGNTAGEYSPIFEHRERGHILQTILLNTVNRVPGRLISEASLMEDERLGVDFKVDDLRLGVVKVQFKSFELGQDEVTGIVRNGVVPIGIKDDLILMCSPRSGNYSEDAVDLVQKSFWAQYDAFASLAHEVQYGAGKFRMNKLKTPFKKQTGTV